MDVLSWCQTPTPDTTTWCQTPYLTISGNTNKILDNPCYARSKGCKTLLMRK
ncbi:MAG: hypothetical protein LBK25_05930 [Treponema sp.]|nr:hypothetical protein [Treponema sp.]